MNQIIEKIDYKVQVATTVIIVFILCVTSATIAYLHISTSNSEAPKDKVVNLDMNIEKILPKKNNSLSALANTDENRNTLLYESIKNDCFDKKKNAVCQVYKISIKNLSDVITQVIDGNISFFADSKLTTDIKNNLPSLKWRVIKSLDKNEFVDLEDEENLDEFANFNENKFIKNINIKKGNQIEYFLLVWIDGERYDLQKEENFFVSLKINSSNGTNITSIFKS